MSPLIRFGPEGGPPPQGGAQPKPPGSDIHFVRVVTFGESREDSLANALFSSTADDPLLGEVGEEDEADLTALFG